MINLLDYSVLELIYDSFNSSVYRALRHEDKQPVILKLLKADYPTPDAVSRYRHEFEILSQLNLSGVIKAYELKSHQDTLLLVIEDFGGDSLNVLHKKRQLTLTELVSLFIQITDSLVHFHANNIIHKDINPANIVWNPETNQLKLIDFGIASRLPRENPTLKSPEQLEGTLAYLSPEQTGRMNRIMDYRTDLYSLGVTFYELLTGRLPFISSSPLELVHCHIAKSPMPVQKINPDVPPLLSDLVGKLMAKNAEDRYQSAFGVKYDLTQILENLLGFRDLSSFTLAQQDFSDKFQVSQKLYGRESAVNPLFEAFEQIAEGHSQLLLVAGYSGIGKTSVVQEIYKPITEKRGYFIAGKFDQFQRNVPYSAVVQAFRDLMRQLLAETQSQLHDWKMKLSTALGHNGQVITDVIAEVELIIGKQPAVPPLPPTESQNRFNLVFHHFIKVFCQPEHPLVIFLDDLQWIDSASLKLMTLVMSDIPYLLIIGAYRDNEVNPVHPLMTTVAEMQQQGLLVHTLTLTPLTLPHLNQLVNDTLHHPSVDTLPLAKLVMEKTGGNPFFIGEFLKTLHAECLLSFNDSQREWQWNLAHIQARNITDNVVALMMGKIQRLPIEAQQVLTLAAAIGNQFDLNTLSIVSQHSSDWVETQLWIALAEGLIVPLDERYKFVHDRIQQAAYVLMPESERPALHWQIGQLLLADRAALEPRLFEVVDHLNIGLPLLTTSIDRDKAVQLNLMAGKQAKTSAAFGAALKYFLVGLELLEEESWHTQYDLTLELHTLATEMTSLIGDWEKLDQLFTLVTQHAKIPVDMAGVYISKINGYVSQGKLQEALDTVLDTLARLGLNLPAYPTDEDFQHALQEAQASYANRSIEELVNLPEMTDQTKLAIMQVSAKGVSPSYVSRPSLFPVLMSNQVSSSIKNGNAAESPIIYACYALVLCGINEIDSGYRFGTLAMALLEKTGDLTFKSKTLEVVNGHIWHYKQPLRNSLPNLELGYQSGLETGDFEYVGTNAFFHSCNGYFAGQELRGLELKMASYHEGMRRVHAETGLRLQAPFWQAVLNLLGLSESPTRLSGKGFELERMLPLLKSTNNQTALAMFYVNTLILYYLFEDYPKALESAELAEQHKGGMVATVAIPVMHFYDSLTRLQLYPNNCPTEQKSLLSKVATNQQQLKYFAEYAPMNHLHKYHLVEAEKARVLGQQWEAIQLYEKAIAGAHANEYLQEEALAYELAAKFYLAQGIEKFARTYLQEAYYRYQQWGALAKVKQLQSKYPQYFSQKAHSASLFENTITTYTTFTPTIGIKTTTSNWLDMESVMKAAQILSGEIILKHLLEKMMSIVIENAGAQRGCLLLPQTEQWFIEAQGSVDQEEVTVLQSLPIDTHLPDTLINYVIRTQETLVLAEARQDGRYATHPYIQQHRVRSVLCFPIFYQQQLRAILYLENNLTPGAFTPDRLNVLTMLSGQIAISLENAQIMGHLDSKVKERTAELNTKIEELTQTRHELVQSEKMASLGRLVAGFAHELNTPLGVAVGSASALQHEAQKVQRLISQEEVDADELLAAVSTIEQGFKLTLSSLERAANLVTSFKRTAVDQTSDDIRSFKVHEVINDIINTLRNRFKHTQIKIEVSCPRDLKIKSLPGALEQILTNLLMNSLIHGFEEGKQAGQIQIIVQSQENQLHLKYLDNGKGIKPENQAKIFEPFFTTHRAHGGSGLGMYICYNLVTTQLQGTIACESELGKGVKFIINFPV